MLSTLQCSSDGFFGTQSPAYDGFLETQSAYDDGLPSLDCLDSFFDFQEHGPAFPPCGNQEPVTSDSGSEPGLFNRKPASSSSGSDEPNRNTNNRGVTNHSTQVPDQRKIRRMISNRESARRSRMRKQKHLENLRNELNRLRLENRELTNRMRLVTHNSEIMRRDNGRLRSESTFLRQRLWAYRQVLLVRKLQQFSPSAWQFHNHGATTTTTINSMNGQNPPL